jgi:hypothetical protein
MFVIITQQMQNKSNKTMEFKAGKAEKNFTEERLTNYTGLTIVSKYIQAQGIGCLLDRLVHTENLVLIPFPNARSRAGWGRVAPNQRKGMESRESSCPGKTFRKKKGDLGPKNASLIQEPAALRPEEDYKNSQLSAYMIFKPFFDRM